ncbi:MAG: chemotaxis protein CheB [Candidatus Cyclobacteriaceae bacterium M2_1C_046]
MINRFRLHNRYKAVVIGGSAGSFQGIVKILSELPKDFPLPIIMCLHRLKHVRNGFTEALSLKSIKAVVEPYDKESIKKGNVYLAPANYHMSIELGNYFSLSTEEMYNNSRPSIDVTLASASYVFRDKLIGILLSGANRDGAMGMKAIKDRGGLTVIQDPADCMIDTMPNAALKATTIDHVLKVDELVKFLDELNKQYK